MNTVAFIFFSLLLHKWQYQKSIRRSFSEIKKQQKKKKWEWNNAGRSKDMPFLTPVSLRLWLWPSSPISLWRTPSPIPEPSSLISASMKSEARHPPYHSGWTSVCLPVHLPRSHVHLHGGATQTTCIHCLLMTFLALIYFCILSDGHRVWPMTGVINICRTQKRKQEERKGKRRNPASSSFSRSRGSSFQPTRAVSLSVHISEVLNSVPIDRNNYQQGWGREKRADSEQIIPLVVECLSMPRGTIINFLFLHSYIFWVDWQVHFGDSSGPLEINSLLIPCF